MIRDASTMDRPTPRRAARPALAALAVVTALALIAAIVWAWPRIGGWLAAERSVDLSQLRLAQVVRGDLQRDVAVQGRVVAARHPTAFSPADGSAHLLVRAGDVVERGGLLARVDSPSLESRMEQERSTEASLRAELERQRILARQSALADRQAIDLARVELDAARRAMDRAERSRAEGILNEVDYETAEDDLQRATLAVDHATAQATLRKDTADFEVRNRELAVERQALVVAEVERQVGDLDVRAPVAGLVARLDVDEHDAVTRGQSLVTVVDLGEFEIEIRVPETYGDEIGPDTPAVVTVDGHRYEARVRSISPEVESSQVRGVVAFTGEAPDGLRQNQRVSTRLILDTRSGVLKVPRGPFLDSGAGRRVWVVEGSAAVSRAVRTGAASAGEIEIVEGLDEGERIIVSDTSRFGDATRIYLRR